MKTHKRLYYPNCFGIHRSEKCWESGLQCQCPLGEELCEYKLCNLLALFNQQASRWEMVKQPPNKCWFPSNHSSSGLTRFQKQTINLSTEPERSVKYPGANTAILQRKCSSEDVASATSLGLPLQSGASSGLHICTELYI